MNCIPVCFFPTRVILVDDEINYLKSLIPLLTQEGILYHSFHEVVAALKYINDDFSSNPLEANWNNLESFDIEFRKPFELFLQINKPYKKFVSTIVSDYRMPILNGLDFLKKIKDSSINKILLTSVNDQDIAINAFNKKFINAYFRKLDKCLYVLLSQILIKNQLDFFCEKSRYCYNFLSSKNPLIDPAFIDYFNSLIETEHIVEYYTIGRYGNFLMKDKNGALKLLITKDSKDTKLRLDSPEMVLMRAHHPEIFKKIANNKLILCLPQIAKKMLPPPKDWFKYACPPRKINGKDQQYFSAVIDNMLDLSKL
jgi:CheY-like chemotaxis protein